MLLTCNIAKKDFSGMQSLSPTSVSLDLDSDILRNPILAKLPPLVVIGESLEIRFEKKLIVL